MLVKRWGEMQADEILDQAHRILLQRQEKYGEFEISAYRTSAIQSIIHEEKRTPEGWCIDMVITKLSRIYQSPDHLDNYLDAICYLAQAAALVKTEKGEI